MEEVLEDILQHGRAVDHSIDPDLHHQIGDDEAADEDVDEGHEDGMYGEEAGL